MPLSRVNLDRTDINLISRALSNYFQEKVNSVSSQEISFLDGVTGSIQQQLNDKNDKNISRNIRNSSYTLVLSDANKLIEMNNISPNTLTIPLNSLVEFPIGTKIDILQTGTGQTTVFPTPGVTLNSSLNATKLLGQWSAAAIIKRDTNTWVLIGDLAV